MMMSKRDVRDFYRPAPWTGEITADLTDIQAIVKRGMDLAPTYQRGSVWSAKQREDFMGHLLQGGEMMPLVVQRVPDSGQSEMVDGKQRTEAILAWLEGEVGARMDDGTLLFRHEVEGPLQRITFKIKYVNMPWDDRKRFYVRFNSSGTPHTVAQLEAALKATQKWELQ